MNSIVVCGDIHQAFFLTCGRTQDRDALRFRSLIAKNPKQIQVLCFIKTILGMKQSSFCLNDTRRKQLEMPITLFASQEDQINGIAKNIYADKIIIGGATTEDAKHIK